MDKILEDVGAIVPSQNGGVSVQVKATMYDPELPYLVSELALL